MYVVDSKKKPEISYPTQFEHTIHVGFDPVTSEFTVSRKLKLPIFNFSIELCLKRNQSHLCDCQLLSCSIEHRMFWSGVAASFGHHEHINQHTYLKSSGWFISIAFVLVRKFMASSFKQERACLYYFGNRDHFAMQFFLVFAVDQVICSS